MTTQKSGTWKDAIISVLQDADKPLHYRRITEIIGERGLRTLSGATPELTVSSQLSRMIDEGHPFYDERIRKVGLGVFQLASSGDVTVPEQKPDDLDGKEQDSNPDMIVQVPAFALRWDRHKVDWKYPRIQGRQNQKHPVNFAEQQGVYILHDDSTVVYVGRTTDNLYNRLREHDRDDHKSARWNKFSWFGFRGVDDQTGRLTMMPTKVNPKSLVSILESVLIETLKPTVNQRRGDYLGIQYEQVTDPNIVKILQAHLSSNR